MLNTSVHMLTSSLLPSTVFADFKVQFNRSNDALYSSKSQQHASGITGGIFNLHWKFKNMESVYFVWINLWCSQVSFMLRVSNCPHCNDDVGHFPNAQVQVSVTGSISDYFLLLPQDRIGRHVCEAATNCWDPFLLSCGKKPHCKSELIFLPKNIMIF